MKACWFSGTCLAGFLGVVVMVASAALMGSRPALAGRGDSALIIFDTSGSMNWTGRAMVLGQSLGGVGGRGVSSAEHGSRIMNTEMTPPTRLEHAQRLASEVIDGFVAKGYDIGLFVFGQSGCRVEMTVPLGVPNSAQSVRSVIDSLKARAMTPIAESLKRATEYIKANKFKVQEVMLITDGMETCRGDTRAAARGLAALGVKLNVVGLDTSATMNAELSDIAALTGGAFRKQDAVGFGGDKIEAGGSSEVSFEKPGSDKPPELPQVWTPPESGIMPGTGTLIRH